MKRNHSIDVLRFFGAFAVIVIHVGYTTPPWEAQIRMLARFAVPFFFLASGYFFEKKWKAEGLAAFSSTLLNLLTIYLVANLIYLPINIGSSLLHGKGITLSLANMLLGTWNHLWFLGAMIVGYLFLWILYFNRLQKLLPFLAAFFLGLMLFSESYSFLGFKFNVELARTFLAIPLLYFGMKLSEIEIEKRASLSVFYLIAISGFLIHVGETVLLFYWKHVAIGRLQFFISTTLMAIGFLCLSLKIETSKPNLLSEWGKKYSLLIYLYHPLVLMWIVEFYRIIPSNLLWIKWGTPIIGFGLTLLPIILIERFCPKFYSFINGKLS